MFSLCFCCRRKTKGDDGDVYGIVNPSVQINAEHPDNGPVQFRNGFAKKAGDRHSHPAKTSQNGVLTTRISAPGRALPQLPGDIYAAIDKSRKDSIRFVDDVANPMYESIDPDADSFIDPLYSKVGDPISTRRDRKYDYPVFQGKRNEPGTSRQNEEMYQSASQIYGGSEDPYSSITSTSRAAGAGEFGEEDSSSAYDPGYAKVKPMQLDTRRLDRIERRENEVDRLYSKIRRDVRDPDEGNGPRPVIDLGEPRVPVEPVFFQEPQAEVEQPDSREPSYRYITVRENAERVRERLREQGQLGPFNREHYYSTIGNEYDTIQLDTSSNTYAAPVANGLSPPRQMGGLSVSTSSSSAAPPPPTSPIPHRMDSDLSPERAVPAYSTVNKRRNTEGHMAPVSLSDWNAPSQGIATSFAGLNRSFTGSMSSREGQLSPSAVASTSATIPGIKEFMEKPVLPYNSAETVLGRRVVEERERIVEQRMSQSTGPVLSGANERVHRVEITRLNSVEGPSADTIISGRRYRANTSNGETGTVVEVADVPHSSRSHLPISVNRAETSRLSDVSHQRRQQSSDGHTQSTLRDPSPGDKTDRSAKKRNTDGAGNSLSSSIYTGKDYVSTMDMGNERPWPISRDPSPSARSDKPKG